jgi:hypothetical protein
MTFQSILSRHGLNTIFSMPFGGAECLGVDDVTLVLDYLVIRWKPLYRVE